jgi:hypothetical protein
MIVYYGVLLLLTFELKHCCGCFSLFAAINTLVGLLAQVLSSHDRKHMRSHCSELLHKT